MARTQLVSLDQAEGKAADLLNGVKKKLGSTPNIFQAMAAAPALFEGYLGLSNALGGGKLSGQVREQIALTVGEANQCDYCLAAHTVMGKGAGLSEDDALSARRASASDPKVDALLKFVRQVVVNRGNVPDTAIAGLKEAGWTDEEILEAVGNVALNLFTNYFNHIVDTPVDFPKVQVLSEA